MVVAFSKSKAEGLEKHYLFRSYSRPPSYNRDPEGDFGPLNPGEACRESIWRCARATSAAPFLFAPIRFNGRKFLDGGMGANNPAMIALKEVAQMHPYTPAVLVSLGTGEKPDHREKNPRRREQVRELRRMDRQSRKQGLKKLLEIASMGKNMLTNVTGRRCSLRH
jgi:predicted acylesterase/phospholipase RssA